MSLEENNELDNFEKIIISEIEGKPEDMQELYVEKLEKVAKKFKKQKISQTIFKRPEIKDVSSEELKSLKEDINIVIFTATFVELSAVLEKLTPLTRKSLILSGHIKHDTYYVGIMGVYNIALIKCKPGSVQRDSISLVSQDAYKFWEPKVAILCGIAYGLRKEKDNLTDVIISEEIKPCDVERVGRRSTIPRGMTERCNLILKNRFENEIRWEYTTPNGKKAKKIFGLMISGEKLVDNKKLVKELKKRYPNAIGGDMEGAGFSATAARAEIAWIVVKAICDWGYKKKKTFK
jgi:nucleoside phosphorylase